MHGAHNCAGCSIAEDRATLLKLNHASENLGRRGRVAVNQHHEAALKYFVPAPRLGDQGLYFLAAMIVAHFHFMIENVADETH